MRRNRVSVIVFLLCFGLVGVTSFNHHHHLFIFFLLSAVCCNGARLSGPGDLSVLSYLHPFSKRLLLLLLFLRKSCCLLDKKRVSLITRGWRWSTLFFSDYQSLSLAAAVFVRPSHVIHWSWELAVVVLLPCSHFSFGNFFFVIHSSAWDEVAHSYWQMLEHPRTGLMNEIQVGILSPPGDLQKKKNTLEKWACNVLSSLYFN